MSSAARLAALALVGGLTLTSCSGGDDSGTGGAAGDRTSAVGSDGASSRASSTGSSSRSAAGAAESPTTAVDVPEGVTLTDPGTELSFGETARVAHEVVRRSGRKKVTTGTVLALTVDSATRGRLADLAGFNLTDPYQRKASYYYVRVTVRNLGEKRLGDLDVPLWGVSGENRLLPPVRFTSAFARCPTEPLPRGFAPGARHRTCLVFLSPDRGSLEGVTYRVTESSTIEWQGTVRAPRTEDRRRGSRAGR